MSSPAVSSEKSPSPRLDARDLHAMLYRDIGIAALAAVLKVNDECRASVERKRVVHPLPAILQGHDLAA
jgi:hypothetical protein